MKKLLGVLFIFLLIYIIYFDLTVGTIPLPASQNAVMAGTVVKQKPQLAIPYFEEKVNPGDTLITVVEQQLKKPLPVSIVDLIHDFKVLNSGQSSETIQIGKTYRFPDYQKKKQ